MDTKNPLKLFWSYFKMVFLVLYKKGELRLPEVKESSTGRGWHLISRHIVATVPEINRMRKFSGDDNNRIRLDRSSPARVQQILFTNKSINYFN